VLLCNEVITVEKRGEIEYHGSSSDELTLVSAAREVGYELIHRGQSDVEVRIAGKRETYKHLKTIEFDSDRKRMTVVV